MVIIFCKDLLHETLKYTEEFSQLKNDEIKKEHTHTSLTLLVDPSMHFDFQKGCACTSLSLS